MEYERIEHTFSPVCFDNSKVLILGTMPSPKSRENGFYYSHPQNRFWPVLAEVLNEDKPITENEKISLLKRNRIALWDVLKSCDICGASDSSIKNAEVNDIESLIKNSSIRAIFTTGSRAYALYCKYCETQTGIRAIPLPSTSPANARMKTAELVIEYKRILEFIV